MTNKLLQSYRLAFSMIRDDDQDEIFKLMEEINPESKQLILGDVAKWALERNPLGTMKDLI